MQGAKGPDTQTQPGPMPGALLSVSKARGACICHLRSSLPLKPRPSTSLNLISLMPSRHCLQVGDGEEVYRQFVKNIASS